MRVQLEPIGLCGASWALWVCLEPAGLCSSVWCQVGTDTSDCLYLALNGRVLRARYRRAGVMRLNRDGRPRRPGSRESRAFSAIPQGGAYIRERFAEPGR